MKTDERIKWLLNGDVSIQYQVHQDLLFKERKVRTAESIHRDISKRVMFA